MTPMVKHQITGPTAWTSLDLGGRDGIERKLSRLELDALRELIEKFHDLETVDITAEMFSHGDLEGLIADVRGAVMTGRGASLVTGLDVAGWTQQECELIFWGLGQHLGYAAVQSARGDRIGYVRDEPDDPKRRGYRSSGELVLHTDSREIIALLALRPAASGGETLIASSATVHNLILKERPDLLPALYRGYRYHSSEVGITDCEIPIFSDVGGYLSCMFFEDHMRRAAKSLNVALPPELDEALRYFAAVAAREDVAIRFLLTPGEMIFCNNFVVLHARTKFEDSVETKRLLARLWINVPDGRPTVPELHVRRRYFDENHDPLFRANTGA